MKPDVSILDDRGTVERLDPQGLLARIEGFPEQCEEAWEHASSIVLPDGAENAGEIVVLGMGGSAIAGDILAAVSAPTGRKPVRVVRGYDLPAFVGPETLVVACSHSGNTEETLAAFEQSSARGARIVAVTTGGKLAELAGQGSAALHRYEFAGEPRAATGHQLMPLLAIAESAGALPPQNAAVGEAVALVRERRDQLCFESPVAANEAKQLAARLYGRLPVVIGAGVLAEAAHRWKTQLNENANVWAVWEELPELNHNSVVGFGLPEALLPLLHVALLEHPGLHPRVLLRYEITEAELDTAGVTHERVRAHGEGALAQVLGAALHGDLVSYYLALLNGVQPSSVAPIDRVKAKLSGA